MKFLIIIPAHNEEEFISQCLESLKIQTFRDFKCVVVNDGSCDNTQNIVENFIKRNDNFELINLEKSVHQPGAKVVHTFNYGLNMQNLNNFDIICKFDSDIIFPSDYLERINAVYQKSPKIGMVSGLVYVEKGEKWQFEDLSSKNHIRGPIKSYSKECFFKMKGLRAVLGWDNIDVMLAQKNGFEIITIKDLWVKHLRPTAYKYKNKKAEKLGEYFYNIGLNFPLAVVSSLKSSLKNKSVLEFFITIKSFLNQNKERVLTKEEISFIRRLRWEEMKNKIIKIKF